MRACLSLSLSLSLLHKPNGVPLLWRIQNQDRPEDKSLNELDIIPPLLLAAALLGLFPRVEQ